VEGQIARWRIGSEIWEEVEEELRGDAGEQTALSEASADADAAEDGDPAQGGDRVESRYVPQRVEGADPGQLPGLYCKIVEFVRGVEAPVRVRDVVEALFGDGAGRSRHEGVRCQLKRLVQRGWLASADGRGFTAVL
jgi:hypothetical protein